MASLLERGLGWHSRKLADAAGVSVEYLRGGLLLGIFTAVPGVTTYEQVGPEGVVQRVEGHDWIFRDSDIATAIGDPRTGDQVRRQFGTTIKTYEVLAQDGQQPFKRDPLNVQTRVHTKLVMTAIGDVPG